jgi:hypothetical protein
MSGIFKATLLLLTLLCAPALSRQQPPTARLIDSFGEIQFSDLMARLDNFAIELQNEPASRGVVVAYGAKHKFPGWPLRRAELSVDYLVNTRGLDAARLSIFNGGLRDETNFELWVVPQGAELSVKPFDVSLLMAGEKTPLLLDWFTVIERGGNIESEYSSDSYPTTVGLYTYFAEALRRDPGLRGCVIGYTSRHGYGAAGRRIAASAKMAIARRHAIEVSRIAALGGGRREYKMLELWLVPPGAQLPKPTPDARRTRRRRR